uniref:T9SS type A sorting domain-containing protein n=1 Tax=candidate division WOR-3 bacterium TaxID=2052148 RepID=A0A7C4TBH9_UNCW3
MNKRIIFTILLTCFCVAGQDYYRNGVITGSDNYFLTETRGREFTVVDSFNPGFCDYSSGLAHDGRYLWNNYAWSPRIARIDPTTHTVLNIFYPPYGDRDMAFDGTYLWVSHWTTNSIYKYDTSSFNLVASYDPPFAGHPNGIAWDGAYLWVGEESGRIYKMNTSGDTIRSIPFNAPYPSDPRGLGFSSDGHLWVGHQGYGRVYEIDTINGTILNWYVAPGYVPGMNFQQGVDFGGGYLWTTTGGTYNRIYKIDIGLAGVEEYNQKIKNKIDLNIKPNPFVRNALIIFTVKQTSTVTLSLLDVNGRVVAKIIDNQTLIPGNYQYRVPERLTESGVYFIVLKSNDFTNAVKLVKL